MPGFRLQDNLKFQTMKNRIEIAYRLFSKRRFPLADSTNIKTSEQLINATFPSSYRSFLETNNGGTFTNPTIGGVESGDRLSVMWGINAEPDDFDLMGSLNVSLFEHEFSRLYLGIGYTLMGGLLLVSLTLDSPGQIFLEPASSGELCFLANDIEEFFGELKPNETNHQHLMS